MFFVYVCEMKSNSVMNCGVFNVQMKQVLKSTSRKCKCYIQVDLPPRLQTDDALVGLLSAAGVHWHHDDLFARCAETHSWIHLALLSDVMIDIFQLWHVAFVIVDILYCFILNKLNVCSDSFTIKRPKDNKNKINQVFRLKWLSCRDCV